MKKLLFLLILASPVHADLYDIVCEPEQNICFALAYTGTTYTLAWDPVTEATAYEIELFYEDGTTEMLGSTTNTQYDITPSVAKVHIPRVRATDGTRISNWASLDNQDITQDGKAWIIIARPAPPTASFGN